jgi:acetyltransferase-like isoleucine patch superfamily enzyme
LELILRVFRELFARLRFARDPIAFHRGRGAQIASDVDLIGGSIHTFGSEPYLVSIGRGVTISHDVEFITHDGGLRTIRDQHPGAYFYAPITVHDNVFIGAGAMILPGVEIGEGAVIGARAVCADDVPARTVVGGVPARALKRVGEYSLARQGDWIDTSGLDSHAKRRLLEQQFGAQQSDPDSAA